MARLPSGAGSVSWGNVRQSHRAESPYLLNRIAKDEARVYWVRRDRGIVGFHDITSNDRVSRKLERCGIGHAMETGLFSQTH
ncbi:MAG: hypothetical protein HY814_13575 [Candidatus Riflebacteria bacterium]|nr:hypothetical protein [Candidatus Riflebacteria bacterium]